MKLFTVSPNIEIHKLAFEISFKFIFVIVIEFLLFCSTKLLYLKLEIVCLLEQMRVFMQFPKRESNLWVYAKKGRKNARQPH